MKPDINLLETKALLTKARLDIQKREGFLSHSDMWWIAVELYPDLPVGPADQTLTAMRATYGSTCRAVAEFCGAMHDRSV